MNLSLFPRAKYERHFEIPVRGDENPKHSINEVDDRFLGFSHPVDDKGDEEDVGEGGVDAPVEGNPPLFAKPGWVVDTRTVCWPDPWCKCKAMF